MRALSVDHELVDDVFPRTRTARVHSVFEHAVNVRDGAGGLFALVAAGTDDAPLRIVLAAPRFTPFSLVPGMPVETTTSSLVLGDLSVDLSTARRWRPVLPEGEIQPATLRMLGSIVAAEGVRGGAGTAGDQAGAAREQDGTAGKRTRTAGLGEAALTTITGALEAALVRGDLDTAYLEGSRLVGLGVGLTPAGDDHLVGLMAAFAMPGDRWERHRRMLARVAQGSTGRTNDISRAALVQAGQGRFRELLLQILRALVTDDRVLLTTSTRRLLAVGHTSGTDVATGLLAGLRVRLGGPGHARHDGPRAEPNRYVE